VTPRLRIAVVEEGLVWYNMWSSKEVSDTMDFIDVLKETELLLSIRMCDIIAISLPATNFSVERSFRYIIIVFIKKSINVNNLISWFYL